MTPHPAAEAAYWAVLSRNRIGDTATPERHREALEAYVKERFGGDPQLRIEVLERMDREAATYVESVICLRSDRFTGEPPYVGWKGLGLALSEDYDVLAAQSARIAEHEAEVARLREALKIIAGEQQCLDNLMGNQDVARAALQQQRKK